MAFVGMRNESRWHRDWLWWVLTHPVNSPQLLSTASSSNACFLPSQHLPRECFGCCFCRSRLVPSFPGLPSRPGSGHCGLCGRRKGSTGPAASCLPQAPVVPSIISGFPSTSGQTNLLQSSIEYIPVSVGKSLLVAQSQNCPGRLELSRVTLLVLSKHPSSGHGGL